METSTMRDSTTYDASFDSDVLAELLRIGLALTSERDLRAMLDLVAESASRVLRADLAACYLFDQETNTYALAADIGTKLSHTITRTPRPSGPTATIVRTGLPLISNDAQNEDSPYRDSPFTRAENVQSVIGIPLKKGTETVGVLYINYRRPGAITSSVKRVSELLANQAAIAVYNAVLFRQLSERERGMARLVDVVHQISEAIATRQPATEGPPMKLVLNEIAEAACQLIGADCAAVYPFDPSREEFYDVGSVGVWGLEKPLELKTKPRTTSGMAAYVRRQGVVIRNDLEAEDPEMLESAFIKREGVRAFMGVAIEVEDSLLGVLYVNFRTVHGFRADEQSTIRLFANQVGILLQFARLLEREQSARAALEMLGIWEQIGGVFAHRLANIAGPTPVALRRIRRELDRLQVQSLVVDEWLGLIDSNLTRLAEMARKLRMVKELGGEPEVVDVNQLLAQVARRSVQAPVELLESYALDGLVTCMPALQLAEVFENIMCNAVEAMPHGGTLTVTTELSGRRWIEVRIGDTGPGMDDEKRRRIFDLFYSEKEGGLGFGLWWSRTFMRHIGGDIFVESEPCMGCTFTVTVPLISV
jgi:GAF domain-containing protein